MNNELIAGNYEDLFVFLDLIYNGRGEVVTKDDETCDNFAFRRDHNLKSVMRTRTIPVYEMLSNLQKVNCLGERHLLSSHCD